ncbi:MAG TPA: phage tail protein [Acidimicrobiales bacterium]|nr:phage tail protein [Acidimicrobiales bacterium]
MRALIPGLDSPHPIGLELPGLFQDDDFAQRFSVALDELLAPIFLTLDAIEAYVDPWLTPEDFLLWISEWVAVPVPHDMTEAAKRALVARAAGLWGWAGTARGLADLVEIYTGLRPEVTDSGGAGWSSLPGGDPPGDDTASVTIRLRVPDPAAVDRERVEALLGHVVPAHVITTVEVTTA